MRYIILLILILTLLWSGLSAEDATLSDAKKVANSFLILKNRNSDRKISELYEIKNDANKTIAYITELKPYGFIAHSADKDLTPILAYSFQTDFIQEDENNLLTYMVKKDLGLRLEAINTFAKEKIANNNKKWSYYIECNLQELRRKDFQQWPSPGSTTTTGWIETTWDQGSPWSMFCPLDPNTWQRSVVGCVATAMSMIIHYHQYVGSVNFNYSEDNYWTNGIHIDTDHDVYDFPSFDELNVYLDTLKIHYQNGITLTNEDMAALCFACGISVKMGYSSSGSGAWTQLVATSLVNKFNYDEAEWFDSAYWEFYNILKTDMKTAQPAELAIYQPGFQGGHAINCDGYNTDEFYHLNFGWGSGNPGNPYTMNAWYSLPEGMPVGYSIIAGAVLNIEGGIEPETITGIVDLNGVNPVGTAITLDGKYLYNTTVEDTNGSYEIVAVLPGNYTATATLGKVWYQTKEVYVDSNHTIINFNPFNYDYINGTVTLDGGGNPIGTLINLIGDSTYATEVTNADGSFEIPDVMPGHYTASAVLGMNYYQKKDVYIDSTNMSVDFMLSNYSYEENIQYYNNADIIMDLYSDYTVEIAARYTPEELEGKNGDIIGKISFLTPLSSDSCSISPVVYQGGSYENPPCEDDLVYKSEVNDFAKNVWIEHCLDIPVEILPDTEYWIGYEIHTIEGKIGWMDEGSMVAEKGAWLKPSSGWTCLSYNPMYDRNWLINITILSNVDIDDLPANHPNTLKIVNYPNPFNMNQFSKTTFSLSYKPNFFDESLILKIYNVKGEIVKDLTLNSNSLSIDWDGKDNYRNKLSSGIYFYQIKSANYSSSINKMILIR